MFFSEIPKPHAACHLGVGLITPKAASWMVQRTIEYYQEVKNSIEKDLFIL